MTSGTGSVLVLGGTGFLGSHLVERLAQSGTPVRVASRRGRWPWGPLPPRVETTRFDLGEITSPRDWDALLEGSSRVVNVAGVLARPGLPADLYRRVHVEAPRLLLEAAARTKVPRPIVHVSTTGVLGPTGPTPLGEEAPRHPLTAYERTKAEGERLAVAAGAVVVRPGLVYGERDLHLLGLWRAVASGAFRTIGGGAARWQPVHVSDVVEALVRALDRAELHAGEIFQAAGAEVVAVRRLAEGIARRVGARLRGPDLPVPVALAAGLALEALLLPFDIDPPLSRARVRTMTEDRLYRIDRAHEALGWSPAVGLEEGLDRTFAWYRGHGHL